MENEFFRSQRIKHEKKEGKTSFADTPQNQLNDQVAAEDNESERSSVSVVEDANEIHDASERSPSKHLSQKEENDDKPDPFSAPKKW